MSSTATEREDICQNCRRPITNHRPWCDTVKTVEPPQLGDMVDLPGMGGLTPIISVCSRQQLIEDGDLVDCTQDPFDDVTRDAHVTADVAMTRAAFERYVEVPSALEGIQDVKGRYWDIAYMFERALRRKPDAVVAFEFMCHVNGRGCWSNELPGEDGLTCVSLKATLGDGDRGEPCITFMLPSED